MQNKTIIYLYGYPGVGKATIASELAKQSGAIMIDNHKVSNLLRDVAGDQINDLRQPIKEYGTKISAILLDFMAEHCTQQSYVLTSVLYENDPVRKKWFDDFIIWAEENGWTLVPVKLVCDLEEAQNRIQDERRHGKHKLMDQDILAEIYQNNQLLETGLASQIDIDVTNLMAKDAVQEILTNLGC